MSAFLQSLQYLPGFFLVLAVLAVLWFITAMVGRLFSRATAESAPVDSGWIRETEPTDEEVAAITAVIMCLLGPKGRIVSIRSNAKDWNREGRREHFASHRIR
ncbi:MAG: hypothetical protein RL648_1093 [Verrucomicrobiota bacterium]|jgi:Na+-transporting methylmalonyl-CoA/oxaloacetate decarboxylase gamma subunit